MKKLISASILLVFLAACAATYDLPVMYKKNYVPGTHTLLRYDGYYTQELEHLNKPFYLYRDGSVWFAENFTGDGKFEVELAKKEPNILHSWGNFKIDADTIYIERFLYVENSNNYRRVTLKGIIFTDAIKWVQREENRQNPVAVDYQTAFKTHPMKPDSTANWTRTRPQYNK